MHANLNSMRKLFPLLLLLCACAASAEQTYYNNIEGARNGNKVAQYNIGYFFYEGKGGVSRDYKQAFEWYSKSANQGYAEAQNSLGVMYANGHGVAQDYVKAVYWFKKSAEQGDDAAQYNLGLRYANGEGVTKDDYMAFYWYQKSAKQGNALAQNNLGVCYVSGKGVKEDEYQAVYWYRKSAEQGNKVAQYNYAGCWKMGTGGLTRNYSEAFRWYKKSAEQGYADAQYELAECYYFGDGVDESKYSAFTWYEKAANQWHLEAEYDVARCYLYGRGTTKNVDQAIYWMKKYLNQEDDTYTKSYREDVLYEAYYELGNCYYTGNGKTQNYSKAYTYFMDAANHGNHDAELQLGNCFYYGHGVTKNKQKAFEWYKKAAEGSSSLTDAHYALGRCYLNGEGVAKDEAKAFDWLHKAAKKGHIDACYEVGVLYHKYDMDVEATNWFMNVKNKGNATQKGKAEKQLTELSNLYIWGTGGSKTAYDYIHSAALEIKAANAEEYIYVKKPGSTKFDYKGKGQWKSDSTIVGKYIVKRVRERWEDRYDTVVVKHPSTTRTLAAMRPKTGTLSVTSKPFGARVYVDNSYVGTTPWNGQLQIGQHKVYLAKDKYVTTATQSIEVPYHSTTSNYVQMKKTWYHGADYHPDHYLEPTYGIGVRLGGWSTGHYVGLRYGWIPKRFGLDVHAMYGFKNQDLSLTAGPTFRLTNFDSHLSLQFLLGAGAMYRFSDRHVDWAAEAGLRFGFREGWRDDAFSWWSFTLGTRYYDRQFIPSISVSLMPVRALALAAVEKEDFPCIYAEMQTGMAMHWREWMLGARVDYIPTHLGVGTSFMVGFEGGWHVTVGPTFRLTPDDTVLDLQLYQGFGYGDWNKGCFIGETGLRFAFGYNAPYFGLWSFTVGGFYGPNDGGFTFGFSLPIVSIVGTAGLATIFYL